MFRFISGIILILCSHFGYAQDISLNKNNVSRIENLIPWDNTNYHSSIFPQSITEVNGFCNYDSLASSLGVLNSTISNKKLPEEKYISIAPLLYSNAGINSDTSVSGYANGLVGVDIKVGYKKLFASTKLGVGRGRFPSYVTTFVEERKTPPGLGYATITNNDLVRFNYLTYQLSYKASKMLNFSFGRSNMFLGEGYRSLLLSDAVTPYSNFKATANLGNFKYVYMLAHFKDVSTWGSKHNYWDYPGKFGVFHYLSWNVSKRLNLSFFESVIWPEYDKKLYRGVDINYLNPVVFYRPVEYGVGSSDNSLIGLNWSYKPAQKHKVYGQILIDEFLLSAVKNNVLHLLGRNVADWGWWANKQAFQFGFKWSELFTIKKLSFLAEYNIIPPYTYAHTGGLLNYGHFNQSLAHPAGANLKETVINLRYHNKNFYASWINSILITGTDSSEAHNYGADIFKDYTTHESVYGNYIGQGIPTKRFYSELKFGVILQQENNMRVELLLANRNLMVGVSKLKNIVVGLSLKTDFGNLYNDF